MCGICGLWSQQGIDEALLAKMTAVIDHRGPDEFGYYLNKQIGLANRRLSIIDLDTGKQPIANENDTIWIVFNGEIYNYPTLRQDLLNRGHRFKTHSDTETIVHLYEELGVDCVKELQGMFAFALWDETKQLLFLARDHLGQKPLFYSYGNGRFIFASEIKSLLQDPQIFPQLNKKAMHDFISLRYLPDSDTLFQNIHKLPAGHILTFADQRIHVRPYWDLHYTPKLDLPENELISNLRLHLLNAVESHLISDVPLGAFLSGGIDSTLITAMMCTLSPTPIKTFSIGVKAQDFNELPYARLVAQQYKTEHHEFIVKSDLVTTLPDMIWHIEEPVDPFAFGVYSVAKLASQYVKVVLGGDGGDELFAGYDRYLGNQLVDYYCLLPEALRTRLIEPLFHRLPDNFSYNNRIQKLRWLAAMSKTSSGARYAASASFLRFTHEQKQALYTDALWHELGSFDSSTHLLQYFISDNAVAPIDKMLFTDSKTRLPDHLLMIGDRMTMRHGIEGRSPYVDHKLVEFVAKIPSQYKIKRRRLKYIQREVAREFLPDTLINRPKQGFSFPLAQWFKGELRQLLVNVFQDSHMVAAGYFQQEAMMNLLDEHVNGRVDHNYRLWLLLNLELWHQTFIEGKSQEELTEFLIRSSGQRSLSRNGRHGEGAHHVIKHRTS